MPADCADQLDRWLPLHEAAKFVPGRGRSRVHASTLARWNARGVKTHDGRRVRLRAVRIASRWVTTRAWLEEFAAAQTPTFSDTDQAPPTAGQRDRAALVAGKLLAEMGA